MTQLNAWLTIREFATTDRNFLFLLHRQTFQTYVEQTWGQWNSKQQEEGLLEDFQNGDSYTISFEGKAIGCFCICNRGHLLFLTYIAILPSYQRRGFATHIMNGLQHQAASLGIPIGLNVLKVNPARSFYERLGFAIIGNDEYSYFMNWDCHTAALSD
jgi:ribosomal protein S18 acetylase RimI-like enzyme